MYRHLVQRAVATSVMSCVKRRKIALDFGLSTKRIHRCISGICAGGWKAIDGPKDK